MLSLSIGVLIVEVRKAARRAEMSNGSQVQPPSVDDHRAAYRRNARYR